MLQAFRTVFTPPTDPPPDPDRSREAVDRINHAAAETAAAQLARGEPFDLQPLRRDCLAAIRDAAPAELPDLLGTLAAIKLLSARPADLDHAEELLRQSLALRDETGDAAGAAADRLNLAWRDRLRGRLSAATAHLNAARELARSAGEPELAARADDAIEEVRRVGDARRRMTHWN